MAKGRLLLLKTGDGGSPETFTDACGFREKTFAINNNIVDTTKPSCSDPGGKLGYSGEYGIQTLTVSGNGEASTNTQLLALKNAALNQTSLNVQVVVPGDGTYEGAALIGNWESSGPMEGNLDFSCDITLSGDVAYTAE